jgi:hypothetical protein
LRRIDSLPCLHESTLLRIQEPAFQDGIIAHAIDEVTDKYNVAYFSAAGNWGRQSYEHAFVDSGGSVIIGPYEFMGIHDFAYGR